MPEKTIQEFLENAESLVIGAAANDDFVRIKTPEGTAVIISESEWNILIEAMKQVITRDC